MSTGRINHYAGRRYVELYRRMVGEGEGIYEWMLYDSAGVTEDERQRWFVTEESARVAYEEALSVS